MVRLSYSQIEKFQECKRQWYLAYVKKIKVESDMKYADRGSVVHEVAEYITNNPDKTIEDVRQVFKRLWLHKGLDKTFSLAESQTWLMCVNIFNEKFDLTSTELKIYSEEPNFVCYIDGVNSKEHFLIDYKTSTWVQDDAYKLQMGFYSLFYKKKFGVIPKYTDVVYVKYFPFKHKKYTFIEDELIEYEKIIIDTNKFMEEHKHNMSKFTKCVDEGKQCGFFCPYPDFCSGNNEERSDFILKIKGNIVYVEGIITPLLLTGINKKFSYELQNAHWIKKARPQMNTTVRFWNENYNCIALGFLDGLKKTLNDYINFKKINSKIVIIDERKFDDVKVNMPDKFLNGKILRDYQNEAVRALLGKKIGVIESGTGSGKTEMAIECIRMLGVRTLFIVDKVELLKQAKQRIEESLGIPVGIIGQGQRDIKDVTVATIQSLLKSKKELSGYLNKVRFAIFDEVHHVPSKSYMQISRYLNNTEFRLGLSATAFRDDGNDMCITAVVGPKIFELGSRELIDKGFLMEPKIIFLKDFMTEKDEAECESKCGTDLINETESYPDYYNNFIVNNDKRNKLIKKIVDDNPGKKILILVKLIEHGEILSTMLGCKYLHGSVLKDDRTFLMDNFKKDDDLLVGTISIFGEGLDIPKLDIIINASANRGNVRTIQSLGRALRKLSGKTEAVYYDFIDYSRFFRLASYARKKILKNEGHEVLTKS